ncbi:hypothetical protein [uncultured Thiocystis sp.]|jgi:acetoin utilization deacetylase AcuC-like enzyme|uniref:hypothetical protein n=1 Tax=uncultured Thiocystis sp. TaxID=1202134 RepID=UPI0025F1F2E5|nr:hypothetical protein [uncultured Thiocystis sp.]
MPQSLVRKTGVVPVFYRAEFVVSGYRFDTTRKAQWIADSLIETPIPALELVEPALLTREPLLAVHAPDDVQAIETGEPRSLAESQGFRWDAGLWPMLLASHGGAVAAARAALDVGVAGSLSSGFHHAAYGYGDGFCTFNGLVIAAHAALAAGARSVLILDLDAHCGGGTASLIVSEPQIRQLDVAVDRHDRYPETAQARLVMVKHSADYLPTIQRLLDALNGDAFDLCLYNAGMDPFQHCAIGGLAGIAESMLAERERLVFDWCQGRGLPIAFVLAGGYIGQRLDRRGLVDLHRLTLSAAARIAGLAKSSVPSPG